MSKPRTEHIPQFYQRYIDAIDYDDLIPALINGGNVTVELLRSIPEATADYRYAEGKWSIREVVSHMMDAERVFCYRALTFARNDKTELPGFDENAWALEANAGGRRLYKLIEGYVNLRASTVDLFGSFSAEMLERTGTASGVLISVNTFGFLISGHEKHHYNVLEERYLS